MSAASSASSARNWGTSTAINGRKSQKKESEERVRRKKMQVHLKVAIHCVFPMICGSGGSKSRLATAAGAEPSGQMRDEKLHAVVAQSIFPSQNVKNTTCSNHFWTFRCRLTWPAQGIVHLVKSEQKVAVF